MYLFRLKSFLSCCGLESQALCTHSLVLPFALLLFLLVRLPPAELLVLAAAITLTSCSSV